MSMRFWCHNIFRWGIEWFRCGGGRVLLARQDVVWLQGWWGRGSRPVAAGMNAAGRPVSLGSCYDGRSWARWWSLERAVVG